MLSFVEFIKQPISETIFFWVNMCVSAIAVTVMLERLYFLLFRYSFDSKNFMKTIEQHVLANDLTKAINHANTSQAPLAIVTKAGLVKANRGGMAVSMGVDEALLQVTPRIEKRVASLWSLANLATLVGLIGTIYGLIRSFGGLSEATPELRAKLLGSGIAEALFNTATGLTIAVTCIFAHLVLSGIAKRIIGDLDYYSSRLENLLTLRSDAEKAA